MKKTFAAMVIALLSFIPFAPAHAVSCVPYARAASGINLSGDAWQWWPNAAGHYERGFTPKRGAVLVFGRQGHMSHGHVSVVTSVINRRVVLVDHANWAPPQAQERGQVSRAVPVIDVSPANDWSQVRVWYRPSGKLGNRIYLTKGFVYGQPGPASAKVHALRRQRPDLHPGQIAEAAVQPAVF